MFDWIGDFQIRSRYHKPFKELRRDYLSTNGPRSLAEQTLPNQIITRPEPVPQQQQEDKDEVEPINRRPAVLAAIAKHGHVTLEQAMELPEIQSLGGNRKAIADVLSRLKITGKLDYDRKSGYSIAGKKAAKLKPAPQPAAQPAPQLVPQPEEKPMTIETTDHIMAEIKAIKKQPAFKDAELHAERLEGLANSGIFGVATKAWLLRLAMIIREAGE